AACNGVSRLTHRIAATQQCASHTLERSRIGAEHARRTDSIRRVADAGIRTGPRAGDCREAWEGARRALAPARPPRRGRRTRKGPRAVPQAGAPAERAKRAQRAPAE